MGDSNTSSWSCGCHQFCFNLRLSDLLWLCSRILSHSVAAFVRGVDQFIPRGHKGVPTLPG